MLTHLPERIKNYMANKSASADRECTLDGGLSDLNTAILTVDVFGERRAP
jgi:hypothetical protein